MMGVLQHVLSFTFVNNTIASIYILVVEVNECESFSSSSSSSSCLADPRRGIIQREEPTSIPTSSSFLHLRVRQPIQDIKKRFGLKCKLYLWSLNNKNHHVDMCVRTHSALKIAECLALWHRGKVLQIVHGWIILSFIYKLLLLTHHREFILQSIMQPRQLLRCYQTICN